MIVADNILKKSLLLDLETSPDGTVLKVGAVCGGEASTGFFVFWIFVRHN